MRFDTAQLAALSSVLRTGAFDLAAAELGVTPSAVSQRIKALEDHTGTALILRGSPCTATAAGQRLAKHAEDVGLLEAQLSRDLALPGDTSKTRLRVAVNADSLATWFVQALAPVSDLLFELVIDDQDTSADWLRRGEVSAAVTASDKPAPGCDRIALGAMRYIATASPAFMRTWFRDGVTAGTLARAPCLVYNAKDRLQSRWMQGATGKRLTPPSHLMPSTHAFVDAAIAGMGWGMNPAPLVRAALACGDLVPLRPDTPLDVPLDWQVSRSLSRALEPLTASVKRVARRNLLPTPDATGTNDPDKRRPG